MKLLFVLTGSVFIASTLISLSRNEAWWIRIFDFPRLQVACCLFPFIVISPVFTDPGSPGDIVFAAMLIASFIYQSFRIYPYTQLNSIESSGTENSHEDNILSILFANILMTNKNTGKFLELVERYSPDIVCVLEPDKFWEERLNVLDDGYRYSVKYPKEDTYGMIVLSKLEMIDPQLRFIIEEHVSSVQPSVC